ncbi:ABC transporter ATP-binding protein [Kitasatospora sp. NPDC050543]|uniref:ABC transporter ATP-binding protein n=1 Tax=Kitasatospora sp. NPDC050543 TaxID=3364054 RepID=UPI00379FDB8C
MNPGPGGAAARSTGRPAARPPARLTARGLVRRFGGLAAVDGVDLTAPAGRITALIGPNGAGKSTLFDCLAGTLRPDAGRVLLGGRDVTGLPAHARVRLGMARTFQQIAVFPTLTVTENVRVGAEQRAGGSVRGLLGLPAPGGRQAQQATEHALALLGLSALRERPAAALPTGTLRLLELARALAGGPGVLLLDEPAAGLDTPETERLARVLRGLAAQGMALLLVEHDVELVADLADTVYAMAGGRVVARGPVRAVLADPRVARAWGEAGAP